MLPFGNRNRQKRGLDMFTTKKEITGDYFSAPHTSCALVDVLARHAAVTVKHEGTVYERALYQRVIYRNQAPNTVIARFVKINGKNWEV